MSDVLAVIQDFDLDAYLDRIGLKERPAPDAEGLAIVQRAQRLSIPFENLDILLGRGISLNPEDVFDKIVARRRGGYCFEQNGLFLRALLALGFEAYPLLARVWLNATDTPSKTHTLNLVTIEEEHWIADAGFGGSFTPPMRLAVGEVPAPDGARYRLTRDETYGWMLERQGSSETTEGGSESAGKDWVPQYSFRTDRVWAADLAQASHFTSTTPDGIFVNNAMVSIVLPNGFASLINRDYSRSSGKGTEKSEMASEKALQMRLSLMFGIDLSAEEIAALGLFPA